jgi:hypothetical protein
MFLRTCSYFSELVQSYEVSVDAKPCLLGNVAVLRCMILNARPHHVKVLNWLRHDSETARSVVLPGGRYTLTTHGSLHVRGVTASDSTTSFYCQTVHILTGERKISTPGRIVVKGTLYNVFP